MVKKHQKAIEEISRRIAEEYQPEKIILFGSFAWGKPTEDSDADFLIVKKKKGDFLQEQQEVRKIIDGEVAADILVCTPEEVARRLEQGDFFFQDIINKGKLLYEKPVEQPA